MSDLKTIQIIEGVPQPRGEITLGLNNDGTFASGPVFVTGIDRAVQDVIKGLLTVRGTNYLVPNYGTSLSSLLNTRKLSSVSANITAEIQDLLGYLSKFTAQEDETERVEELTNLKATESLDTINLELTVKTGAGQTASVSL